MPDSTYTLSKTGAQIDEILNSTRVTSINEKTGAVTLTASDVGAASNDFTAVLVLSTNWSGNGPYTQTITLNNYTVTSNTRIDLQSDKLVLDQMIKDGTQSIYIDNNNGTLTAYAIGAKPTAALGVQYTAVEVQQPHIYGEEPTWTWRRINGAWAAFATFTCLTDNNDTLSVIATITSETIFNNDNTNTTNSIATVIFNGKEYSNTKTETYTPVYTVYFNGVAQNLYMLGSIVTLGLGNSGDYVDWYVNGELVRENSETYGFILSERHDYYVVTTAPGAGLN